LGGPFARPRAWYDPRMRRPARGRSVLWLTMCLLLVPAGCRQGGSVAEPQSPVAAHAPPDRFPVYSARFTPDGYEQRYGYIDATGRVVIPLRFRYAHPFDAGLGEVRDEDGAAFINRDGKVVFRIPDDRMVTGPFGEGLAWFVEGATVDHHTIDGGRWGCIDRRGRVVIPPQFGGDYDHQPGRFSGGLARVWFDGKWGFVDRRGRIVVEPAYDEAGHFSQGLALVGTGPPEARKYGYIDPTGNLVIPMRYAAAAGFSEGLAAVRLSAAGDEPEWSGFIDRSGRRVLAADPVRYDGCDPSDEMGFHEGLAAVRAFPAEPLPPGAKCQACERPVGGMLPSRACPECQNPVGDRAIGFINPSGQFVIPPILWGGGRLRPFSEGLCAFEDGGWGYLDRTGAVAIAPRFEEAVEFRGGLAEVWIREGDDAASYRYVDRAGNVVWEPKEPVDNE
jgi:hypothetical protein